LPKKVKSLLLTPANTILPFPTISSLAKWIGVDKKVIENKKAYSKTDEITVKVEYKIKFKEVVR